MDVWATLADFCNILTAVNQSEVPLYKDPDEDLSMLSLEEDRLLSGFVPLLVAPQEPCYVEKSSDKVRDGATCPLSLPPSLSFPQTLQPFFLGKCFCANGTRLSHCERVLRENIDLLAADIPLCVMKTPLDFLCSVCL